MTKYFINVLIVNTKLHTEESWTNIVRWSMKEGFLPAISVNSKLVITKSFLCIWKLNMMENYTIAMIVNLKVVTWHISGGMCEKNIQIPNIRLNQARWTWIHLTKQNMKASTPNVTSVVTSFLQKSILTSIFNLYIQKIN